jgi:hypothetical protein
VGGHPNNSPWRTWKSTHQDLQAAENCNLQNWTQAISPRRIRTSNDPDILRWGHSPHGNFTLKEGYTLQEGFQSLPKDPIWTTVWKSKFWPKISMFLWLLLQNKILTWDNLQKRGFIGPSICHLCHQQAETMEHLLNNCTISVEIWDHATQLLRRTNRDKGNIINTIRNWGSGPYKSQLLNRIWQLLPGFIVWQLWKERNRRVFHSQPSPLPASGPPFTRTSKKPSSSILGPKKTSPLTPRDLDFQFLGPHALLLHFSSPAPPLFPNRQPLDLVSPSTKVSQNQLRRSF